MDLKLGRVFLVRGIPGSGKTTFAKELCRHLDAKLVELDMYRQPAEDLPYIFTRLESDNWNAARWVELEAARWLRQGIDVVYSSTLTKTKYIEQFLQNVGVDKPEKVIVCAGEWEDVHDVPADVVRNMKKSLENNPIEGQIVLDRKALENSNETIKQILN